MPLRPTLDATPQKWDSSMSNGFNLRIKRCWGFSFSAVEDGSKIIPSAEFHHLQETTTGSRLLFPRNVVVFQGDRLKKLHYNTKRAQTSHSQLKICSSHAVIYGNDYQVFETRCRKGLWWLGWGKAGIRTLRGVLLELLRADAAQAPGSAVRIRRTRLPVPAAFIRNFNPIITHPL